MPSRILHRVIVAASALLTGAASNAQPTTSLPERLSETGLYVPGSDHQVDPRNLSFSPQYPLWSDGAHKRRWIFLPPGTAIDASNPDAWDFPVGTRLWKEFSLERPVETRYIERLADGTWRFATYIWDEAGRDAAQAPSDGATLSVGGGYSVPAEADCRGCHEGAAAPVLGFSALQLSSDRDPLAPHADAKSDTDLAALAARGLIRNLDPALLKTPPRIQTNSPVERAALGYLHGNCAHCHNHNGTPVPVDLTVAQSVNAGRDALERVLRSMIDARTRFRGHGLGEGAAVVVSKRPDKSVLLARMRSRDPQMQMPPLGTQLRDDEALALLERWITERSSTSQESTP